MNIYEIAKKIVDEFSYQTVRKIEADQYELLEDDSGLLAQFDHEADLPECLQSPNTDNWMMLDVQTANAIITVFEAINPQNRARFLRIPLEKMASICWHILSKGAN